MEAIEFITKCNSYIEEIREVIRPDLIALIDELKEIDPHDLVKPDTFFMN